MTVIVALQGWLDFARDLLGTLAAALRRRLLRTGSPPDPLRGRSEAVTGDIAPVLPFVPGGKPGRYVVTPDMKPVQERAVIALFRRLDVEWVPPIYREFLERDASPIAALRLMCEHFGIPANELAVPGSAALGRFRTVVDGLVAIDVNRGLLGPVFSAELVELLRNGHYTAFSRAMLAIEEFAALRAAAEIELAHRPPRICEIVFERDFVAIDPRSITGEQISTARDTLSWIRECLDLITHIQTLLAQLAAIDTPEARQAHANYLQYAEPTLAQLYETEDNAKFEQAASLLADLVASLLEQLDIFAASPPPPPPDDELGGLDAFESLLGRAKTDDERLKVCLSILGFSEFENIAFEQVRQKYLGIHPDTAPAGAPRRSSDDVAAATKAFVNLRKPPLRAKLK